MNSPMSRILNVIYAAHARSTHHKLALDALMHLKSSNAEGWRAMLLNWHTAYLDGAKAPDDDFRDFRNHVLHVSERYWGGAVSAAHNWYATLVDLLRAQDWKEAAFAAGVLSHYYTDPLMPFHTGQSESEGAVHRACEWSVTQSYDDLRERIRSSNGYPVLKVPASSDWLGDMVRAGANTSHPFYDLLIDHYNLQVGVKNPKAGMDETAQGAVASCLAHATVGFADILDRAFLESSTPVPEVNVSMQSVLATINVPIRKLVNKLSDGRDRAVVEAIWKEVETTGKAVQSLPESEKLVRKFHAAEVLHVPMSVLDAQRPRPAGSRYVPPPQSSATSRQSVSIPESDENPVGKSRLISIPPKLPAGVIRPSNIARPESSSHRVTTPSDSATSVIRMPAPVSEPRRGQTDRSSEPLPADEVTVQSRPEKPSSESQTVSSLRNAKYWLTADAAIVDAPSIGPKTADRFNGIGVRTVGQFVQSSATEMATRLNNRQFSADVLRDWQDQSRLMMTVPNLRGHDAQLLVAAEVRTREDLLKADAEQLLYSVETICDSSEGRRILRDSAPPDLAEVRSWISSALATVALKAG